MSVILELRKAANKEWPELHNKTKEKKKKIEDRESERQRQTKERRVKARQDEWKERTRKKDGRKERRKEGRRDRKKTERVHHSHSICPLMVNFICVLTQGMESPS